MKRTKTIAAIPAKPLPPAEPTASRVPWYIWCGVTAVTSAIIGPRTMEQLDDLLAGVEVTLTDDVLDQIDESVPPGTDVGTLDMAYRPPAVQRPDLRRRPVSDRAAA